MFVTHEQIGKAYYVNTHPDSFRTGEPAEIIDTVWVTHKEKDHAPRACFHVRYKDGVEDLVPVMDNENYTLQAKN